MLVVVVVALLPTILYILSFRKTGMAVNRSGGNAPVNSAWLLLVPMLNVVWYFVLLIQLRVAVTLSGRASRDNLWWTFGMIAGGVGVLDTILSAIVSSPGLQFLLVMAWLVFAILHWVNLVRLRTLFT
jgi:hypothetical protein